MEGCIACDLISGAADLPGGRIHETSHWVIEHCVGPLGVGSLIVKPFRHVEHVWDLTDRETQELGPLLKLATETIRRVVNPDQVYVCLWSHSGWNPVHIHFVLQPAWNSWKYQYAHPGTTVQEAMFEANDAPQRHEVEAFANSARTIMRGFSSRS